jgi:chorismate-pyruvate lyase
MDLLARGTCVPAVTARGAIVEKGLRGRKAIGEYLNNHRATRAGAAKAAIF